MLTVNRDYFRAKAEYIAATSILNPVGFFLRNNSGMLAENVRLEINGQTDTNLILFDAWTVPREPRYSIVITPRGFPPQTINSEVIVDDRGDMWSINVDFGSVQPKATVWSRGVFYIGSRETREVAFDAIVYADNLAEPLRVGMSIAITTQHRVVGLDQLMRRDS
jgi:hypothetical protein